MRLALAALPALVALVALASACAAPPLTIQLAIDSGSGSTCPEDPQGDAQCELVQMACPTMLLVRVLDPSAPEQPLIQSCLPVTADNKKDLCAIASVGISPNDLPPNLPEETLEVQIAVLPFATGSDGQPDCQPWVDDLTFSSETGVAESEAGEPPIAGHAYYHPGDAVTVVELGCTDLSLLNTPQCVGTSKLAVSASVVELDSEVSVASGIATQLAVSVGAPTPSSTGSADVLDVSDSTELGGPGTTTPPAWSGQVAVVGAGSGGSGLMIDMPACLQVLDEVELTVTVVCEARVASSQPLDFAGVHISGARLKQIEDAVTASDPLFDIADGLVVGIVLDPSGNPVTGAVVSAGTGSGASSATVSYIAPDGMSLETTSTSRGGIFVSTDAPFATTWTSQVAGTLTSSFGGLVENKVTVVVMQAPTHT